MSDLECVGLLLGVLSLSEKIGQYLEALTGTTTKQIGKPIRKNRSFVPAFVTNYRDKLVSVVKESAKFDWKLFPRTTTPESRLNELLIGVIYNYLAENVELSGLSLNNHSTFLTKRLRLEWALLIMYRAATSRAFVEWNQPRVQQLLMPSSPALCFSTLDSYSKHTLGLIHFAAARRDKFHMLLEHADRRNLEHFFGNNHSPTNQQGIITLGEGVSSLIKPLSTIHNVGQQLLRGWHQDVKPANILVYGSFSGLENYEFMLTDLGLTPLNNKTLTTLHKAEVDGAPESQRQGSDDFRHNHSTFDIWSLGCLLSEAAVWIACPYKGVIEYRKELGTETSRISDFEYTECFHNRQSLLGKIYHRHVSKQHRRSDVVLSGLRRDKQSPYTYNSILKALKKSALEVRWALNGDAEKVGIPPGTSQQAEIYPFLDRIWDSERYCLQCGNILVVDYGSSSTGHSGRLATRVYSSLDAKDNRKTYLGANIMYHSFRNLRKVARLLVWFKIPLCLAFLRTVAANPTGHRAVSRKAADRTNAKADSLLQLSTDILHSWGSDADFPHSPEGIIAGVFLCTLTISVAYNARSNDHYRKNFLAAGLFLSSVVGIVFCKNFKDFVFRYLFSGACISMLLSGVYHQKRNTHPAYKKATVDG